MQRRMKIYILVCLIVYVNGQLRWESIDRGIGDAPSPRTRFGFGYDSIRDQIIVFGGNPGPLKDTWIFDVSSGEWRLVLVTASPEARFGMVSGISGDFFYIATGEGENKRHFNDIWRFDLRSEEWEKLPSQRRPDFYSPSEWATRNESMLAPEARFGSVGGIYFNSGDEFFVNMGFDNNKRYINTYSYNVKDLGWNFVNCKDCNDYNPSYPHARCLHAGTMIDRQEFVIFGGCLGGGGTGGPCPSGDSWKYSGKTQTWTLLPDCAAPRTFGAMAALPYTYNRRRVVLYGGMEHSDQIITTQTIPDDQIAVYDPDTNTWTLRRTLPLNTTVSVPNGRSMAGMATAKDGIYMFGGMNKNSNTPMNDLWILRGSVIEADESELLPCTTGFINFIAVHAYLMVIGWGFFLQWGGFIARYLKFKNPLWFYLHVTFQIFGLCCAIAGLVMGILSVPFDHLKFPHSIIGVVVMVLGILQPINALIRPNKQQPDETKSFRRRFWEFFHHFGGRLALVLALVNISLGVFLAVVAPLLWILWFAYLGFLILVYAIVECVRSLKGRSRSSQNGMFADKKKKYMMEGMDNNGSKQFIDVYL
ncbi:hypothetical protein LOTGIDRAFT_232041 [Lottia gigantea]|uniref:Cytochrome b561 domain-containing protein n=1 Tax=Lottia gigantea TaxID=225164 RepID=V4AKW3_LOTGI|nr:hypothetical protein LOTGIDRAFT_232041 [Lottia gigantea]ESO95345.1 hypothetical protein LOTGIDRAFT_232041 [Lottia gigantea]